MLNHKRQASSKQSRRDMVRSGEGRFNVSRGMANVAFFRYQTKEVRGGIRIHGTLAKRFGAGITDLSMASEFCLRLASEKVSSCQDVSTGAYVVLG